MPAGNARRYALTKLETSLFVLWNLTVDFNLSSADLQVKWGLLSVFGLMCRRVPIPIDD